MISKRSKRYRGAMGAYARSRNVWQRRHAELTVKYEARGRLLKAKRTAERERNALAAKLTAVTVARDKACDLADEAFRWAYDDYRYPREGEVAELRNVDKESK